MNNVVGWFEINVDDMDRAKKFYSNVFQQELQEIPMGDGSQMMGFPWVEGGGGASGALVKNADSKPGAGGITVYFSCVDCAEEQSRVEENGGKVIVPKTNIGEHGFFSLIEDSEGNTIGLHSRS
jgi:hypothetical protein